MFTLKLQLVTTEKMKWSGSVMFQVDYIWPLSVVLCKALFWFCCSVCTECVFLDQFLVGSSPGPCSLQPGCTTCLTLRWRRPMESGPGWARLMGGLVPGSWAHFWVWPWEPQPSYLAQAGGALGFLCKNQSAFPLVVWLPLRRETLPSSVIVPSSSNVAQSASSRAWSILENPPTPPDTHKHTPLPPPTLLPPTHTSPTPFLTSSALHPSPATSTSTGEQLPITSCSGTTTTASLRHHPTHSSLPLHSSQNPQWHYLWSHVMILRLLNWCEKWRGWLGTLLSSEDQETQETKRKISHITQDIRTPHLLVIYLSLLISPI